MAIVTDNFVAYDTVGRYYYLTEAGLIEYTGYQELIDVWKNPAQRLKLHGRQLHSKMTKSAYNGKSPRYTHKDIIEYNVYLNECGERNAIIEALTNMIEATYEDEWDRTLFSSNPVWLDVILDPLHDAHIYYTGEILQVVPEDEYQVGY